MEGDKCLCQKQYALSIDHVSKTLGGQKRINDMSIHCEYGQIYGLIGPNGSGKTTLLKLITGLYQPDEGEILVGGLDPSGIIKRYAVNSGCFHRIPHFIRN